MMQPANYQQQLKAINQAQEQRYYQTKLNENVQVLQQATAALSAHLNANAITQEDAFVTRIFNPLSMEIFFSNCIQLMQPSLSAFQAVAELNCPSSLPEISYKQRLLQELGNTLQKIQPFLAQHSGLYGICNYQESYLLYQKLQRCVLILQHVCTELLASSTEAMSSQLAPTDAEFNTLYTEITNLLSALAIKYAAQAQVAPKPALTNHNNNHVALTHIIVPDSINSNAIATNEAPDSAFENTLIEHLKLLPPELFLEIATFLDPASLYALALTGKTQAKHLLPLIKMALKSHTLHLTSGYSHTLLFNSYQLLGKGCNVNGQLGLGDNQDNVAQFTVIPGLSGRILQIAAGGNHTLVLTTQGLFGCGSNGWGQLGFGDDIKKVAQFTVIPGLSGRILQIATGMNHTLVFTTQGLFGCGSNKQGQLGLGDDIAYVSQFTLIAGLTGRILLMAAGSNHTVILTMNGLFCSGDNQYGQLGLGHKFKGKISRFTHNSNLNGQILRIAAGLDHTLALTTDGLLGCGNNGRGELGLGNKIKSIHFNEIEELTGQILQIAAGPRHTLALTIDGLFGCGTNFYGELGLRDTSNNHFPTLLPKLKGHILKFAGEYNYTFVLTTDGLFAWGNNEIRKCNLGQKDGKSNHLTAIQHHEIQPLLALPRKLHLVKTIAEGKKLAQKYLMQADPKEPLEKQKAAALSQCRSIIQGTKTLETMHTLLNQLQQASNNVLRIHRKNLIFSYGDTDSYRSAILALAEQALTLQHTCSSFTQYNLLHAILAEALRCYAPKHHWKQLLIQLKQSAFQQLQQELKSQTDLNQLLGILTSILQQNNLLRFETRNILQTYGNTSSYKANLLLLAKQINQAFSDQPTQLSPQAQVQLQQLLDLLKQNKPRFNLEWQNTIDSLNKNINQKEKNSSNNLLPKVEQCQYPKTGLR